MGSSPEPEAATQNPYEARLKGNCQEKEAGEKKAGKHAQVSVSMVTRT